MKTSGHLPNPYPLHNPDLQEPVGVGAWLKDDEGKHVQYMCTIVISVSLVATLVFQSIVFAMPALLASGFFCGCLAKKAIDRYDVVDNVLMTLHRADRNLIGLRFIVPVIISLAALLFPVIAGVTMTVFGAYCGAQYV